MSGRSSALRGPRRTRVYDCNYNMGESYYKPAIENLDRKYNREPEATAYDRLKASKARYDVEHAIDEELSASRQRASKAIREEPIYEPRRSKLADMDSEFDEQVGGLQSSLSRIRANKKMTNMMDDLDIKDTFDTVQRKSRLSDLTLDDDHSFGTKVRKSKLKMISNVSDDMLDTSGLTKWTAIDSTSDTGAMMRAKATKARLDDIETDMFERSEKQAAREKRSANLRKFMADEFDTNASTQSIKMSSRSEKIVNFN